MAQWSPFWSHLFYLCTSACLIRSGALVACERLTDPSSTRVLKSLSRLPMNSLSPSPTLTDRSTSSLADNVRKESPGQARSSPKLGIASVEHLSILVKQVSCSPSPKRLFPRYSKNPKNPIPGPRQVAESSSRLEESTPPTRIRNGLCSLHSLYLYSVSATEYVPSDSSPICILQDRRPGTDCCSPLGQVNPPGRPSDLPEFYRLVSPPTSQYSAHSHTPPLQTENTLPRDHFAALSFSALIIPFTLTSRIHACASRRSTPPHLLHPALHLQHLVSAQYHTSD
ncbi:hypothetical protein F5Y18DRAFT_140504 [Xylariaceae sp. FL1019]|nr:hypothetical protein F5Y18DRAFT_140504 [Xylariaceae sp. FL1019]